MASSEFHTALLGLRLLLDAATETNVVLKPDGTALTKAGPAPYPTTGNILDDPELLWTEDCWDDDDTADAEQRVTMQGAPLPEFWRSKYTAKASAYWHGFYKRNADHFYKDRHYLHIVYKELLNGPSAGATDGYFHLLEVGHTSLSQSLTFLTVCGKFYNHPNLGNPRYRTGGLRGG